MMNESRRDFRLRRSVLFVPGADRRKIERARDAGADTLVLDLEDAVSPDRKGEARALVVESLRADTFAETEIAVRINPPGSPYFEDDLEAMRAAATPTLLLPKAQSVDEIASVGTRMGPDGRLLLLIETPLGVADALSIGRATPVVDGLCFGHADFSLEMGLARADTGNPVVQHARASIAIAAKARRLAPIDCVHLDVRDEDSFRADTALGLSLGFEGRLCIHPRQVELANQIYTPSAAEIEYAQRVVEAFEQSTKAGSGVATIDGKMVDAPLVAQQKRLLARAKRT